MIFLFYRDFFQYSGKVLRVVAEFGRSESFPFDYRYPVLHFTILPWLFDIAACHSDEHLHINDRQEACRKYFSAEYGLPRPNESNQVTTSSHFKKRHYINGIEQYVGERLITR